MYVVSSQCLYVADVVSRWALRHITNLKTLTKLAQLAHLNSHVGLSSTGAKGLKDWFAFIYKSILPTYFPPPLFAESVSLCNFESFCKSGGGEYLAMTLPFPGTNCKISWNFRN